MQINYTRAWNSGSTDCGPVPNPLARLDRYPVWMWWNLLSLDAPTVVFLWALLFAHSMRIALPFLETGVLAATVWIIYVCDRVLDGLHTPSCTTLSVRHIFYARHHYPVLGALLPIASATIWISLTELNGETRIVGLVMCGFVGFYFAVIHAGFARVARWFPKELIAGTIFAAGAVIPAWMHAPNRRAEIVPPALLFAALCALNCIAIECWEHRGRDREWKEKPYWLIQFADSRIARIAAILVMSVGVTAIFGPHTSGESELLGASAVSLLILAALDWRSNELSPGALRVLADAALLTPAFFLLKSLL